MKIKIVTTEKKLTLQLIKQMQRPDTKIMEGCEVLGYIMNIAKGNKKLILLQHTERYFILPADYRMDKNKSAVSRKVSRHFFQVRTFKTPAKCKAWWDAYQKVIALATRQIYV